MRIKEILYKIPAARHLRKAVIEFLGRDNYIHKSKIIRGMFTKHNSDFKNEPLFKDSLQRGIQQFERFWRNGKSYANQLDWERQTTVWAACHAKHLTGDFVECGVATGMTTMTIVNYLDFNSLDRKFYLFDTFNGLDKRFSTEKEYATFEGLYPDSYQFVKDSFKDYKNVILVKGAIPLTLSKVNIEKVAYLHIDMNGATPEIEAIKFFWPKLEAGAIVVLDDYGWARHINQKIAMDEFARIKGVKILTLPTGQGMMVK